MDACRSRCTVGRAVVTTRLSSVVMKSARLVIASVHPIRLLEVIACPLLEGCECLRTSARKKTRSPGAAQAAGDPVVLAVLAKVHGRSHVQEHAHRKEGADLVGVGAGHPLHEVPELAVAPAHQ